MSQQTQPDAPPSAEQFKEMMKEFSKPVPEHELLAAFAGTFDVQTSYWLNPGGDPMVSAGISQSELIFDGRYAVSSYVCQESEFRGKGTIAFDKTRGEYVSTWLDNMGTGIMLGRGSVREDGVLEIHAEDLCPQTKQPMKIRSTYTFTDPGRFTWEMYYGTEDDGEAKVMECLYRRRS